MNKIEIKRRPSEEGIGIVIVLLGVLVVLWGLRSLHLNSRQAKLEKEKIERAFKEENSYRFVHQMIADDALCTDTDFMTAPPFFDKLDKTTAVHDRPIELVLKRNFVNYSTILGQGAGGGDYVGNWPGSGGKWDGTHTITDVDGNVHSNVTVEIVGLGMYQPKTSERPVLIHPSGTRIRVPIDVLNRARINGGAEVNIRGGIETYVEFEAGKAAPVACYKAVSSRSLCLDMGKIFYPLDAEKCR